jgi:prepilin-type N-terminal cleavage/methylation domain-containing protein
MKMLNRRQAGFTLIEIMIVVAIIGLLMAVAIPNLGRARRTTQTKVCVANLRMIQSAKQQWALENGKSDSDTPTEQELSAFHRERGVPQVPGGRDVYDQSGRAPTRLAARPRMGTWWAGERGGMGRTRAGFRTGSGQRGARSQPDATPREIAR